MIYLVFTRANKLTNHIECGTHMALFIELKHLFDLSEGYLS